MAKSKTQGATTTVAPQVQEEVQAMPTPAAPEQAKPEVDAQAKLEQDYQILRDPSLARIEAKLLEEAKQQLALDAQYNPTLRELLQRVTTLYEQEVKQLKLQDEYQQILELIESPLIPEVAKESMRLVTKPVASAYAECLVRQEVVKLKKPGMGSLERVTEHYRWVKAYDQDGKLVSEPLGKDGHQLPAKLKGKGVVAYIVLGSVADPSKTFKITRAEFISTIRWHLALRYYLAMGDEKHLTEHFQVVPEGTGGAVCKVDGVTYTKIKSTNGMEDYIAMMFR